MYRDRGFGHPLNIRRASLAEHVTEARQQDEVEDGRMRDEQLRRRRPRKCRNPNVRLNRRLQHPSPQRPEPVHHRVLRERSARICGLDATDDAGGDLGELRGTAEGLFVV